MPNRVTSKYVLHIPGNPPYNKTKMIPKEFEEVQPQVQSLDNTGGKGFLVLPCGRLEFIKSDEIRRCSDKPTLERSTP